jgi:hypothetical protein
MTSESNIPQWKEQQASDFITIPIAAAVDFAASDMYNNIKELDDSALSTFA